MEIFSWTGFLVAAVILLALYYIYDELKNTSGNLPPSKSGWIPFIGCALDFGKAPLTFIETCRLELGPVFTMRMAGRRMTYLTESEDYQKYFLQSEHVDFQKAVELFVQNAASIKTESFQKYHTVIHDMMKGKLAAHRLPNFTSELSDNFTNRFNQLQLNGRYKLNQLTRSVMYPAVIKNLFGEILPINSENSIQELTDKFVLFDDQFEYGTQIPQIFLSDWAGCKDWLLSIFRKAMNKINPTDQTLLKSLYDTVDKEHAANYSLLMLWASLANAIPITFWTIAFILNDDSIHSRVREAVEKTEKSGGFNMQSDEMLFIKSCILEAIRIRSPGVITRMVVKPFQAQGYTVPAGDLLMLSPYWTHRKEEHFPEPDKFIPDRWSAVDLSKNEMLEGFISFGGGRYMCPGRFYAMMELQMIIYLIFTKYDLKLDDPLPHPNVMHLVGVQQPAEDCHVLITPKN